MPISSTYRPAIVTTASAQVALDGWGAGQLSPGVIDAQGTLWALTKLDGWHGAPDVRSGYIPRPGAHGFFDGPAFLSGRVITLEGTAVAVDQPSARLARDIVASVLGDPLLTGTLVVTEPGQPTRQCVVRRSAETKTQTASPTSFLWSLILTAPDPRRYDANLSTQSIGMPGSGSGGLAFPLVFPLTFGTGAAGGSMTITNTGTIAAFPTLTMRGPVTGATITNVTTGQVLAFDSSLSVAAGHDLIIDTDARTVTMDGINQRAHLLTAQWWDLDPGSTQLQWTALSAFDANARLTVSWRNAWT